MKIIQSFLTENDCYKANKKIKVQGLMLHSVGCPQPSANVFIKRWNKSGIQKCVHAFIEANGDVYQTLPWDHRGWHAGGNANNTHIGVEMCEPSTIKYTSSFGWTDLNPEKTKEHVMSTYKTAVELFAMLCKEFRLNPLADGVIISHSEGYKRGVASGHADVEHIWSKYGLTMNQFRQDVKKKMDENMKPQKSWQQNMGEQAIDSLAKKSIINNPEDWKAKDLLNEPTPLWLTFVLLDRLTK